MSKNRNKFKFCIGSSDKRRSNIWTVVPSKDDVYMISRSFGKDFKVSIHGSGVNQTAVTKDFMIKHSLSETERLSERWYYNVEGSEPQIIFIACFLANHLLDFSDIDEQDSETICIPPPEDNCYVEVLVYKSLEKPINECIAPSGYNIFKHFALSNGQMLVFMYHYPKLLEDHIKIIEETSLLMKKKKIELGIDENKTVAAHFQAVNDAGERRFCELYV